MQSLPTMKAIPVALIVAFAVALILEKCSCSSSALLQKRPYRIQTTDLVEVVSSDTDYKLTFARAATVATTSAAATTTPHETTLAANMAVWRSWLRDFFERDGKETTTPATSLQKVQYKRVSAPHRWG